MQLSSHDRQPAGSPDRAHADTGRSTTRAAGCTIIALVSVLFSCTNGGKNGFDADLVDESGDEVSTYAGGWEIGDCQDDIEATVDLSIDGFPKSKAGDVLPDFHLVDQFGDSVRLYDFCHKPVYLEWAALW